MGQDSWQAEQRNPYFLAKAGRAFADGLTHSIKKARIRPKDSGDDAKDWRNCAPIRMPYSFEINVLIGNRGIPYLRKGHKAEYLDEGTPSPRVGPLSPLVKKGELVVQPPYRGWMLLPVIAILQDKFLTFFLQFNDIKLNACAICLQSETDLVRAVDTRLCVRV